MLGMSCRWSRTKSRPSSTFRSRSLKSTAADLLDDPVELGILPAHPVARRLELARLGDVLGMVAVEEEGEVGVTAPGLDRPGDVRLVARRLASEGRRCREPLRPSRARRPGSTSGRRSCPGR